MDRFEELVRGERERQEVKWGEQNHQPGYWAVILGEEFGEVCRAVLEHDWPSIGSMMTPEEFEEELVQVAAVAKAMWESGKRQGWL